MVVKKLSLKALFCMLMTLALAGVVATAEDLGLANASLSDHVVIETSFGDIVLALDAEKAPVTVTNFLRYVDRQAYDGTIFHRVISGFMIQGGGHFEDLSESPSDPPILNEADNGLSNQVGTIAMARLSEIDTASNQFFINTADNPRLDHGPKSCSRAEESKRAALLARGLMKPKRCKSFGYAVFGEVIQGMDVVRRIEGVETGIRDGFFDVPVEPIKIVTIRRVRS